MFQFQDKDGISRMVATTVQTYLWQIAEKQNGINSAIGGGPITEDDG